LEKLSDKSSFQDINWIKGILNYDLKQSNEPKKLRKIELEQPIDTNELQLGLE
jgi:hypothetical protein